MSYIEAHADIPHAIGSLAVATGLDNGVVSRVVAGLVKAGRLTKAGRGVVTLTATAPVAEAAPVASEAPSF
jgi:hypothetical protein